MGLLSTAKARIRNLHPDHHAIAQNMGLVALFVLLTSVARAAREISIAYRYGITAEVDAYLFVFNLVSWPVSVWFSLLTVVLVPLIAQIRQDSPKDLPLFRAELLGLTLVIALVVTSLTWLGLRFLLASSWTGMPSATADIALQMVPTLTLLAPLGIVISLFSALLLAAGSQANTLQESVPALVLIAALLLFTESSVEPLVWGTLAGFILHLLGLGLTLARRREINAPTTKRLSPQWVFFWNGLGIMLAGQVLMSFSVIIDQFFAAHLETGAIAQLSYANRLLALILGMGAMVVTRATLPAFSKTHAQGGLHLKRTAAVWASLMFVFGATVMSIGWWLAPFGVALFFERGAFTSANTAAVADTLIFGLPQMPFYFAGLVLVSLLVSQRKYALVTAIGGLNLFVKVAINVVAVPYFGVSGLMVATSVMLGFSCLCLAIVVYKDY